MEIKTIKVVCISFLLYRMSCCFLLIANSIPLYITCGAHPSLSIFFSLLYWRNSLPAFIFSSPVSSQCSLQVLTEYSFRFAFSSAKRSSSEYGVEEVMKQYCPIRFLSFTYLLAELAREFELYVAKLYRCGKSR